MVPASLLKIAQQKAEECEKECERAEKRAKEVNDKFEKLQIELDASKGMVSGLQAEVCSGFRVKGQGFRDEGNR
jgi:predicted  nucleic acid-binding Zn-ribbon protein